MYPELQTFKQPTEDKKSKDGLSNDIAEIITRKTGKITIDVCGLSINLICKNCKKGMLRTKHNICIKCQIYRYCMRCKKYHEKKHNHPTYCDNHWNKLTKEDKIYIKKEAKAIKNRSKIKDIASICLCFLIYKKTKKFLPF